MISLLLLLACSANALEVKAPSPNSGTITPSAITTGVGSFSGSVTASSVTSQGGLGVGGAIVSSMTAAANHYIRLPSDNAYYLSSVHTDSNRSSPSLVFEGRSGGASQQTSMQHSGGSGGYWGVLQGGAFRLSINVSNGFTEIGNLASPDEKLHVRNGNIKADYGVIGSTLAISGSTFTVATTGIVSAPSQPGAQLYIPSGGLSFAAGANEDLYWDTTVSNRASYNRQQTVLATSSNTFTARGAGLYYASCCARITTTGSTSISIRTPGSTIWLRTYGQSNPSYETLCVQGFLNASDGDTYSCRPTSSQPFTIETGIAETNMTFQKVW